MKEKFQDLIDQRNYDLWDLLREVYDIKIEECDETAYMLHFEPDKKKAVFYVNMENIGSAPFTHEMLHLFLKYNNVLIASDMAEKIANQPHLCWFFSDSLQTHIGNTLEHKKMFPLYLERGFKAEDFVSDYHEKVMNQQELEDFQVNFCQQGLYNREVVDSFIGKFFSMKAGNNPEFDYSACYIGLQKIDTELYNELEKFWQNWLDYNIDQGKNGYQIMLSNFLTGLTIWVKEKTLV